MGCFGLKFKQDKYYQITHGKKLILFLITDVNTWD